MKINYSIGLILLINLIWAQPVVLKTDELLKVLIIDHQNNNYQSAYGTKYEIRPQEEDFALFRTERYFINLDQATIKDTLLIRVVPYYEVQNLLKAIANPHFKKARARELMPSANYLKDHAERIAKLSHFYHDLDSGEQKFFAQQLRQEKLVYQALRSVLAYNSSSDYPTLMLKLIYPNDSIEIFSTGQGPYMLPWDINGQFKSYNPAIATQIASLLPDDKLSNKFRLEGGVFLEKLIADEVYRRFCEPEFTVHEFELLMTEEIEIIKEHFDIKEASLHTIGSIDWDALRDGACWSAHLHDKNQLPGLNFQVTMKREEKPGSIKPLLAQKDSILETVEQIEFLMDYLSEDDRTSLNIHFTEGQSFSKRAQGSFLEDVPDSISAPYLPYLNQAIFIRLHSPNAYSNWLIFPNGDIMLWYCKGSASFKHYGVEQLNFPTKSTRGSFRLFDKQGKLLN